MEVSHNSRYGQPGPLAYKLDTLIVNRRIEEASRPIPKIIKLGSQAAIADELGISHARHRLNIKKALYQNASAYIDGEAPIRLADGGRRNLKRVLPATASFSPARNYPTAGRPTRFTSSSTMFSCRSSTAPRPGPSITTTSKTYPRPQRLYEILSYRMYAALKNGRPRAKLSYGEFCTHAPLTRHDEWLRVRTQMNKLHAPHKKSGYIASVEFEQTSDRDGKPDWLMLYTPGPKARAEFRAFDKKGGPKTLVVEKFPPALEFLPPQVETSPLERELIARGIVASTAAQLVANHPEDQITAQVEHFDWLKAKQPKSISKNPGGFLADAIRQSYPTPPGFETKAQRAARDEAKREKERQETEARRLKEESRRRDLEVHSKVNAYLTGLTAEEQEQLDTEALEQADPALRAAFDQAMPVIKRAQLRIIREGHVRRILGIPETAEG